MSDIPQVEDQFIEEARSDVSLASRYIPSPEGRFAILCADDFHLDELRRALNAGGFALTAHAEGWFLDKIHAIALVQAANEPEGESE